MPTKQPTCLWLTDVFHQLDITIDINYTAHNWHWYWWLHRFYSPTITLLPNYLIPPVVLICFQYELLTWSDILMSTLLARHPICTHCILITISYHFILPALSNSSSDPSPTLAAVRQSLDVALIGTHGSNGAPIFLPHSPPYNGVIALYHSVHTSHLWSHVPSLMSYVKCI